MNKLAIAGIDIEDADINFITFNCRDKYYKVDVNIADYLEEIGALEGFEDKWGSGGHYTNDWKMTVTDYLEGVSIYDVALDYLKDTFETIKELLLKSKIEEC